MKFHDQFEDFERRLRELLAVSAENPPGVAAAGSGAAPFNALALELFALQFEHNGPYRRFCAARGASPQTVFDWSQIPAVPASAFKELELSCLAPEDRTTVFHSSGTTEQRPSRHFHNAASLATYEASLWPWFARHLCARDQELAPSLLLLTPPPDAAPCSSLVHMFEHIRQQPVWAESAFLGRVTPDGAWMLGLDAATDRLKRLAAAGRPAVLLGTAFSFVHLLDFLGEHELRPELPPGSRVMETGGYKGRSRSLPRSELHNLITARLGIPPAQIVCEYGMSELSSQAYDGVACAARGNHASPVTRRFNFPPWARAQLISPETGEEVPEGGTGLLRVFDLANVYSVMAIQTEDLGLRRGTDFELAGRAALAEVRGCSLMAE
ncbi:MAG TPA: hypothetical protein VNZ64_14305 [Candidatus Acidoferrum sp.]|jgi:hypothetical protein|nr:hypothetical protein [Candidatus Acidoferrum sp.]